MILGCILLKKGRDSDPGLSSLLAVCDEVQPVYDLTDGMWSQSESGLRQQYIDAAIERNADVCVTLDTDEYFTSSSRAREILARIEKAVRLVQFVRIDKWDDRCRYRWPWDGSLQHVACGWRPANGQRMSDRPIHCGRVPNSSALEGETLNVPMDACSVIHTGYQLKKDRDARLKRWKEIDPQGRCMCDYDQFFSDKYIEGYPF